MHHHSITAHRRIAAAVILSAFATLVAAAPSARAGRFDVQICDASQAFSSKAFDARATRGMLVKRACDPRGSGVRGVVTANALGDPVPRGASAIATIGAPPGTTFASLSWSGTARRTDCAYALQVYAAGPDPAQGSKSIKNVRANRNCPRGGRAQSAGWSEPRTFDVSGTTQLVQRVICSGAKACSARSTSYLRTNNLTLQVQDDQPPAARITGGSATSGRWLSGTQDLQWDASDNVGVQRTFVLADGTALHQDDRPCDFTVVVPCPNGAGSTTVDTTKLADGTRSLIVRAHDPGGNDADSAPAVVHVDNTAPSRVAVATGVSGWSRSPGFPISWTNPNEPDRAPIAVAHYTICQADGQGCGKPATADAPGVDHLVAVVPAPGVWTASVWLQDSAGNEEQDTSSLPVTLRYDPDPPVLAFHPVDPANPRQVVVDAKDAVSGVAQGAIEMSLQGSDRWQALDTKVEGGQLTATIPDTDVPSGTYLLRARADDVAGNETSTTTRADGTPMTATLPIRTTVALKLGMAVDKATRVTVGKGKRKRVVTRHESVVVTSATARLGGQVVVDGTLATPDGQGLADAPVTVTSESLTSPAATIGTVTTDGDGRFSFPVGANQSQKITFSYAGTDTVLPTQADVAVQVPAETTIAVDHRRVLNGRLVRFAGKVQSLPVPGGGKLIEIQVQLSGRWQTFLTTHTDAEGRWTAPYRFKRTCGRQTFRFRVGLPKESGTPFEGAYSRVASVQVRGRPCA